MDYNPDDPHCADKLHKHKPKDVKDYWHHRNTHNAVNCLLIVDDKLGNEIWESLTIMCRQVIFPGDKFN